MVARERRVPMGAQRLAEKQSGGSLDRSGNPRRVHIDAIESRATLRGHAQPGPKSLPSVDLLHTNLGAIMGARFNHRLGDLDKSDLPPCD